MDVGYIPQAGSAIDCSQRFEALFVHLNWARYIGLPGMGVSDGRQELEQKLERMIMGQEYDAWKCGKAARMDSRWFDH
jgi:hypothetical protein